MRNKQTAAFIALALAVALFSVGFFLGRQTVPYEAGIEVQRPAASAAAQREDTQSEKAQDADAAEETLPEETQFPINLNTATLEELCELPRIGSTLAQRILDYRAQYGRFSAAEQLMDVEGIGETTFEGLKDLVTVEDSK